MQWHDDGADPKPFDSTIKEKLVNYSCSMSTLPVPALVAASSWAGHPQLCLLWPDGPGCRVERIAVDRDSLRMIRSAADILLGKEQAK